MRSAYPFNQGWSYCAQNVAHGLSDDGFVPVTLPHSNVILPYHNFDDAEHQFVSTYRKRFALPEALRGRRLLVEFEGAMIAATVTLNGHTFPEHRGGFTPFTLDLTPYVDEIGENLLTVHLDSTERKDIPPFGHTVDYLVFGGIYREVTLHYVEPVYIDNVFVKPRHVLTDSPSIEVDVRLHNASDSERTVGLYVAYGREDSPDAPALAATPSPVTVSIPAGQSHTISLTLDALPKPDLWSPDQPTLYRLVTHVMDGGNGPTIDRRWTRFGFREAQFKEDGFYLNGQRLQLMGLNRHQAQRRRNPQARVGRQHRPHLALPPIPPLPRPVRRAGLAGLRGNPGLAAHR
ncbi:MAG: hypothetical protein MUC99_04750 [Anaerolineae bacterium]|nr:hypothetical protein [Anaerolineae bacterium]